MVYAGKGGLGYDVYVGRRMTQGGHNLPESIWHNPFKVDEPGNKRDGTLDEVLDKYERYLRGPVENDEGKVFDGRHLLARLPELEGKVLGCWCAGKNGTPERLAADDPLHCHGQLLLRALNGDFLSSATAVANSSSAPLLDDEEIA